MLYKSSRDLIAFFTPVELIKYITFPQRITNSIVQFVKTINKILAKLKLIVAVPFLNDIRIKSPYTDYNQKETLLKIRRFILKYIQNLDKTLERIERAGVIIGPKSQFCRDRINIVGFVYNSKGKEFSADKIIKILN